ncbi:hypothetical protein BDV25DRAFT_81868 [Aspergillus avenaceus]|uniref:Uncharacterized protein n=1 Tax=Aspergillus avenaceus TaxID=36643 RepID=A0A5N6U9F7_ASPAV|nr:hypothetical protein BDV25DRAFT_81868 [Aspergillus avenaceus]
MDTSSKSQTSQSSLIKIPPSIHELREQFFTIQKDRPIILPEAEFNDTFKFFDNMVVQRQKYEGFDFITEYWSCRLWGSKVPKPRVSPQKRQRVCTTRTPIGCPYRIRIVRKKGQVTISALKEPHNHNIEVLQNKLSSGVREILGEQVSYGYRPSEIARNLKSSRNGNTEALELTGNPQPNYKHVWNCGKEWIHQHPDPRI